MTNKVEYAFIIPAYNPDEKLLEVVQSIQQKSNNKIFLIDDGSKEETQYRMRPPYFAIKPAWIEMEMTSIKTG